MIPNKTLLHRAITAALLDVPHLEPTVKDVEVMVNKVYMYLEGVGYEAIKIKSREEKQ